MPSKTFIQIIIAVIFVFLIGSGLKSHAQEIDDISFMTEEYPPYNFCENGQNRGISVDLLCLMLKRLGSKKTIKNIEVLPWVRGYLYLQTVPNSCLFSTTRTKEREALFKWVGPIMNQKIVLIARKDKQIKINRDEDLKAYRIGTVRDDVAESLLIERGLDKKALSDVHGPELNVRKLNANRIDVWAYGESVAIWLLKKDGYNSNDFETVYILQQEGPLYYAFHKDTSDKLIKSLQSVLDQLKSEHRLQQIIDSYLK